MPRLKSSVLACALLAAPAVTWAAPEHGQINVVQNDPGNMSTSVTITTPLATPGFRVVGGNRGDYDLATTLAPADGVVITAVRENGRNNDAAGDVNGTQFVTPAIAPRAANTAYFVPLHTSGPGDEFNTNVAGIYFRYDEHLAGFASNTANNGALDTFVGSAGINLGTEFTDPTTSGGTYGLDLRNLTARSGAGAAPATSSAGVLLVTGGKNEDNYALSRANADGTFTVFCKDNGSSGAGYENDGVAFAYVSLADPLVPAVGRVRGDGTTDVGSGNFAVTKTDVGTYFLTIAGQDDTTGTLIVSAEGGETLNVDNIVSYQPGTLNGASGWYVEVRDIVNATTLIPPLEDVGTERAFSFAFATVPEPSTAGLLLPAAVFALRRRVRRRPVAC
jgi:hypothetical protein